MYNFLNINLQLCCLHIRLFSVGTKCRLTFGFPPLLSCKSANTFLCTQLSEDSSIKVVIEVCTFKVTRGLS